MSVSHGWQKYAVQVHEHHQDHVLWPRCLQTTALVRSHGGPLASMPFTALPVHRVSKMDSEPHRSRCGRPLDAFCHHRAACSTVGVLGRRGFAAENAIAEISGEGGVRVSMLRDFDIHTFPRVEDFVCTFAVCFLKKHKTKNEMSTIRLLLHWATPHCCWHSQISGGSHERSSTWTVDSIAET